MKKSTLLVSLGLAFGANAYAQNSQPAVVDAPVEKIFVPSGFDDNDNSQVVLYGNFPDACYRVGSATAQVDTVKHVINVQATSLVYQDEVCLQAVTPFIQTVDLGQLPEGNYEVVYSKNQSVEAGLDVARRKTESPDDYLYATVENATLDVNKETGKQSLKLSGHYPYYFVGCMVIREVRVVKDPADVLVVQPIAELVDTEECDSQPQDRSFEYTAGLSEAFSGNGLIHVRTLNGNAINRLIQVR